ncbi:pyroglutamyl-peptidase I [Brachybacterium paraconglomeratum]|uniref:pyroglutamyl-peptidase I family protein n=1 Tax=Brachybacterium paraconglomeratum TaxID=173362 RepID=UPI00249095BC|nr:pyroglutamyl-peptidase I [Brachybacterium paraconglomeratum]
MAIDVLLSGFAPFDGAATNESWEAVREAVPALVARGVDAEAVELPVEFGTASERLAEAVRGLRPRLVVAVGLAAGRTAITPERVAINIRDARIPDNAGASPVDEPVVPGAPVGRFSTLPVKAMVASLAADGVPAAVSQTAGTYVCNDVFYALQHLLATDPALEGIRAGSSTSPRPTSSTPPPPHGRWCGWSRWRSPRRPTCASPAAPSTERRAPKGGG